MAMKRQAVLLVSSLEIAASLLQIACMIAPGEILAYPYMMNMNMTIGVEFLREMMHIL